jgi:hypothetical protein
MREVSDRLLATLLAKRLQRVGVFQMFIKKLGPSDVTYVSAFALAPDDNVVEGKASAMDLEDALVQLFANLDLATQPEDP